MLHDSPAFSVCGQSIERIWNQGASWFETVGAPTAGAGADVGQHGGGGSIGRDGGGSGGRQRRGEEPLGAMADEHDREDGRGRDERDEDAVLEKT